MYLQTTHNAPKIALFYPKGRPKGGGSLQKLTYQINVDKVCSIQDRWVTSMPWALWSKFVLQMGDSPKCIGKPCSKIKCYYFLYPSVFTNK